MAKNRTPDPAAARIHATVDSESRSYTDPRAASPRARQHQADRVSGAARCRPN